MSRPSLSRRATDGVTVLGLRGELDLGAAVTLRGELEAVLQTTPGDVVVDLAETTFLDSAGIDLLFDVDRALRRRGQRLRLVVPDDSLLRRTLEVTGMRDAFGVHGTVDDAVRG